MTATTSQAFQEGYAAFPFQKKAVYGSITSFSTTFTPTYDEGICPYRRPNGQKHEPWVLESEWAQWWKGYRMAAAKDEEEFFTTKEYR